MKVKVKRLSNEAVLPKKAHPSDAGFDLVATSRVLDKYGNIVYGTGLAFEIPEGYVGLLFPRSSICKRDIMLTNAVGVIDCHYRGEVMAKFRPIQAAEKFSRDRQDENYITIDEMPFAEVYGIGERIAQLIVMPLPDIEMEEADHLTDTDRGTGGYGSSGV